MKYCPQIEWRTKTERPTEPGWYWGRWRTSPKNVVPFPTRLITYGGADLHVVIMGDVIEYPLSDFDFFGPVTMVKEG